VRSRLLIAVLASLLASPVHAQFLGGSAADERSEPLGQAPLPEGRTPDRTTKPPQQVDFNAPHQMDFGMDAARPDEPVERRAGAPAGRMDRRLDRLADEPVDSAVGASAATKR
jgi:hypothetical protein